MTPEQVAEILGAISYRDWIFRLGYDGPRLFLQVVFKAGNEWQRGRKWLLSPHMTKSELVQTAFKAVLTAEEHEAREHFRYMGAVIFGPHFDVDRLAELASAPKDVRPSLAFEDPLGDTPKA